MKKRDKISNASGAPNLTIVELKYVHPVHDTLRLLAPNLTIVELKS